MPSADEVVVDLVARTEGFDIKMKQTASSFGQVVKSIEKDAGRAEKAIAASASKQSTAIGQSARALKRDMLDVGSVLSGSSSPFAIVPKQAPAVSSAMRGISVAGGALGGIMGGAVTLGIGLAVTALTSLIRPSNMAAMAPGSAAAGTSPLQPITFDLRGAVMTEDLVRQMTAISARQVAQGSKATYDAVQKSFPERLARYQKLES